jgi:hypothetical protein
MMYPQMSYADLECYFSCYYYNTVFQLSIVWSSLAMSNIQEVLRHFGLDQVCIIFTRPSNDVAVNVSKGSGFEPLTLRQYNCNQTPEDLSTVKVCNVVCITQRNNTTDNAEQNNDTLSILAKILQGITTLIDTPLIYKWNIWVHLQQDMKEVINSCHIYNVANTTVCLQAPFRFNKNKLYALHAVLVTDPIFVPQHYSNLD